MTKPLLLIGGGGHCKSVIDVIESQDVFSIKGIIEQPGSKLKQVLGYPVVGTDDDISKHIALASNAIITIGQIKSAAARRQMFDCLIEAGAYLPIVTSPHSCVSKHAELGGGTCIMHGAVVNAAAKIGQNCILNSQCLIEHDAIIEDHCHVSTGACINGGVSIGSGSFIGSGAILKNGISVGANSVIGAGCVVLTDLPANSIVKQSQHL